MKNLFTFFLDSKIFLSICVFSLALSSQYILKQYHINVLTILFFGTFLSYNYQRLFFKLANQQSNFHINYKTVKNKKIFPKRDFIDIKDVSYVVFKFLNKIKSQRINKTFN